MNTFTISFGEAVTLEKYHMELVSIENLLNDLPRDHAMFDEAERELELARTKYEITWEIILENLGVKNCWRKGFDFEKQEVTVCEKGNTAE